MSIFRRSLRSASRSASRSATHDHLPLVFHQHQAICAATSSYRYAAQFATSMSSPKISVSAAMPQRAEDLSVFSASIEALHGAFPWATVDEISALVNECQASLAAINVYEMQFVMSFAEQHLIARKRNQDEDKTIPLVIFCCGHNAGRSQMAEAWFRYYGKDRVISMSSGSGPSDHINPKAMDAMLEKGIDMSKHFNKPISEEIIQASNMSITMGCGDVCPKLPFVAYTDWALPDPHGADIEAVRSVRDEIEKRVIDLCGELGVSI